VYMVIRADDIEHVVFTPSRGRGVMHGVLMSLAEHVGV
jgi:hypothetical protein